MQLETCATRVRRLFVLNNIAFSAREKITLVRHKRNSVARKHWKNIEKIRYCINLFAILDSVVTGNILAMLRLAGVLQ